ncbi:hypothetical protein PTKIN_Ptkin02bG0154200 [Pterospermum kingtungense]
MEGVRMKCGMDACFSVDAKGSSRGLSMMWTNDVELQLCSFSRNHIDMEVVIGIEDGNWRLTGIYGEPATQARVCTWSLLRNLKTRKELPWICFGDFNGILWSYEKSGNLRMESQMEKFRHVLEDCGLMRSFSIEHLTCSVSDHCPLAVRLSSKSVRSYNSRRKHFHFEAMWVKEPVCGNVVKEVWEENDTLSLGEKLQLTGSKPKKQHQDTFGHLRDRIFALKVELEILQVLD